MTRTKIYLLLVLILALFACKDKNDCMDLDVEPYYDIKAMAYHEFETYYYNINNVIQMSPAKQDYSITYNADNIALYFIATDLSFHSQHIIKPGNNWLNWILPGVAYACEPRRNGDMGTLEKVRSIVVSSNAPYDETHDTGDNLNDLFMIFGYWKENMGIGKEPVWLSDYNTLLPLEAPKRFYLILRRNPTLSKNHTFTVKYYMYNEAGEASESYIMETPAFSFN